MSGHSGKIAASICLASQHSVLSETGASVFASPVERDGVRHELTHFSQSWNTFPLFALKIVTARPHICLLHPNSFVTLDEPNNAVVSFTVLLVLHQLKFRIQGLSVAHTPFSPLFENLDLAYALSTFFFFLSRV